jgi:POT family proton-dependent oligopeptide transporter
VANSSEGTILGHPKGLFVLFFTEMWERFSFYSMRAILALYMVQALLYTDGLSNRIYGAYLGFVYSTTFIGGILADRLLGQRRAIFIGGFLMAAAQFTLAVHALCISPATAVERLASASFAGLDILFFFGMGMLSTGNGFFKPNISTIVGTLYEPTDSRRDSAFTIFYFGINLGAFFAGFSGELAQRFGWHWGFLLAGTGMLLGQVIFFFGRNLLKGKGLPPRPGMLREAPVGGIPSGFLLFAGIAVAIPIIAYLLSRPQWVADLATYIVIPVLIYLFWEAFRSPAIERDRIIVIIALCAFSMVFWGFFELAGSAIVLFTNEHVDTTLPIIGEITPAFINASLNALFILILSLPFAKLWVWLDKHKMDPPSPLKFSLGLAQLGLGFFVLFLGAMDAAKGGKCSVYYLMFGYLLHTTGELCLSPVGLSMITRLSPARLVGMFMGVWFLSSSLGNIFVGAIVGRSVETMGYGEVFKWIGVTTVGAGVLLLILTPFLKRMTHGLK